MTGQEVLEYIRARIGRELEMMRRDGYGAVPSPMCFPFACLWHQHGRAVQMHEVDDEYGRRFIPGQMVARKAPFVITNQKLKPYPKFRSKILYL